MDNAGLGLKLINGLSEDIEATFNIESNDGTKITAAFERSIFSSS